MNTLNWLCSKAWPSASLLEPTAPAKSTLTPNQPSSQPTAIPPELTYSDIADQLSVLYEELAQAKSDVVKARQQTCLVKADLLKANDEIKSLRSKSSNQTAQIRGLNDSMTHMHKNAAKARASGENQRTEIKKLVARVSQLKKEQGDLTRQQKLQLDAMQDDKNRFMKQREDIAEQYRALRRKHGEVLFELEHFKCVEKPDVDVRSLHLMPQPFAVVLIDGDAYAWSPSIFTSKNPGAMAAFMIQQNVEAHLATLPDTSPYTKVVTRAFINAQGIGQRRIMRSAAESKRVFMRQFTEALPLFDFFDSGSGKERADFKIKDNFHLYLSNPNCQHIYLATCTDNGFARMLEPYRYHPIRKNITLISPGWLGKDLEALDFEVVAWPDIFLPRRAPPLTQAIEARQRDATKREVVHNKQLGLKGDRVGWIACFVADIVEDTSEESLVEKAMRNVSVHNANVGVRSLRCREARAGMVANVEDEDDTDVEVHGVD